MLSEAESLMWQRQQVADERRHATKWMWINLLFVAGGCSLTAATYAAAEPGDEFFVFWGAIAFGGFLAVRHWVRRRRISDSLVLLDQMILRALRSEKAVEKPPTSIPPELCWEVVIGSVRGVVRLDDQALRVETGGTSQVIQWPDVGAVWRSQSSRAIVYRRDEDPLRLSFLSTDACESFCSWIRYFTGEEVREGSTGVSTPVTGQGASSQRQDQGGPPPAGWYPDPDSAGSARWWTGTGWGPRGA